LPKNTEAKPLIDDLIINNLPESSGVYIFRDREKNILYIGKAKNIKERVRSYAREGEKDAKTERLVDKVGHVDFVLTRNEKEAFLLENNLIKENKPRYNVNLKDDKTYVSLKLTLKDRFPALYITREIKDDGALYFGPYPHAKDMKDVLKIVQGLYPVRRCRDTVFKKRKRACMLFELEKCLAPCVKNMEEKAYRDVVDELVDFLSGKDKKLLKGLEHRIEKAAESWNFEEANILKERHNAIKEMLEAQHVHEHLGKNRDVWAFLEDEGKAKIVLLSFRKGVLVSKRLFEESLVAATFNEALSSFLFQYYTTRPIPDEIILSEEIEDIPFLKKYLGERKNGSVRIYGPYDRASKDMIALAVKNLYETEPIALEKDFKKVLHLRVEPSRIEVYDISHTHGKNPSGVMVMFENFKATKKAYRVFHIRGASSMDDIAMMRETLERRIKNEKMPPLPDLFIIDGGKGHLSGVMKVMKALNVDIDVIGIAKGQRRNRMEDLIYLPLRKNPLLLTKASPVFKEIVKMRDEAHRFALLSHRRWKDKEDLTNLHHNKPK
jgi:excinuclease ABC subunit C